ncbi:MAG: response regulator [Nanoarchaeota archaeon]
MTNTALTARVLIGDDEPISIAFIKESFEDARVQIDEATSSADLIKKAKEACDTKMPYNLIITDNNYRGVRGIEAIRQIRDFDRTTPIMWHSTSIEDNADQEAKNAGANDTAEKYTDNDKKIIRGYIEKWQALA